MRWRNTRWPVTLPPENTTPTRFEDFAGKLARAYIYRIVGSALYLVGTILVTIIFNVPRNEALAAVEAGSSDGATRWAQFVPGWTAWNHLRTAAALAAAASLTSALCC